MFERKSPKVGIWEIVEIIKMGNSPIYD